jgi:hypothetical protein
VVVEILVATDDEVRDLRVRQLVAVRRFLQTVIENRKTAGVSRLAGSVGPKSKTEAERAQGGTR